MTQNVPKLKLVARRRKVIELRAKGKTIQKIAEELGVSEKTIDRDLKSQQIQDFIDELIRQQLEDIIEAEIKTRLQYRNSLLNKLMPKQIEQKTETKGEIIIKAWDLGKGTSS